MPDEVLPRFKIPPRRVAADDCAVHVGRRYDGQTIIDHGETYYPHAGEWVEVLPVGTVQAMLAWNRLQVPALGESATPAEYQAYLRELDAALAAICAQLATVVVAWSWTDLVGQPLPQPYGRPDVLLQLELEELTWLKAAASGETGGERKNGSGPSPATTPARARRQKR